MGIVKKYFVVIVLAVLLSSCTSMKDNNIDVHTDSLETPEIYEITKVLIPEQDLIYRNEAAGYQLTFPENWQGHYVIAEYNGGTICMIGFYGKSKTGQLSFKDVTGHVGLELFWIGDKPCSECSIRKERKIGEVNGVSYFYVAHGGRNSIGILHGISRPNEAQYASYEVDGTELELAAQDWEKANIMCDEIDDVLESFTAIR